MRYSAEHKKETRARLLKATGALVKTKGFAATGVDGLMAAADLTSGAFYSHFRSKAELLEAIVENELERSIERFSSKSFEQGLAAIDKYLSLAHIAKPESGCLIPSLAPEIARANEATQRIFEDGILKLKDQIKELTHDDAQAWSIMTQLIGTVMTARGLPSEQARIDLLAGVKQQITEMLKVKSTT